MASTLQHIGRCHREFAKGTKCKILLIKIHALYRRGQHLQVFLNEVSFNVAVLRCLLLLWVSDC